MARSVNFMGQSVNSKLESPNGKLVLWDPVVWDFCSGYSFHKGRVGIQSTGTQTTNSLLVDWDIEIILLGYVGLVHLKSWFCWWNFDSKTFDFGGLCFGSGFYPWDEHQWNIKITIWGFSPMPRLCQPVSREKHRNTAYVTNLQDETRRYIDLCVCYFLNLLRRLHTDMTGLKTLQQESFEKTQGDNSRFSKRLARGFNLEFNRSLMDGMKELQGERESVLGILLGSASLEGSVLGI